MQRNEGIIIHGGTQTVDQMVSGRGASVRKTVIGEAGDPAFSKQKILDMLADLAAAICEQKHNLPEAEFLIGDARTSRLGSREDRTGQVQDCFVARGSRTRDQGCRVGRLDHWRPEISSGRFSLVTDPLTPSLSARHPETGDIDAASEAFPQQRRPPPASSLPRQPPPIVRWCWNCSPPRAAPPAHRPTDCWANSRGSPV